MKVLKENDNPKITKLRALEQFLTDNDIRIYVGYDGLHVHVENLTLHVQDIDGGSGGYELPRQVDSERFVVIDDQRET